MTKDIQELIERLEKAIEPDRELDRAVARLIGRHRVEPRFTRNKHDAWIAPDDFIGLHSGGIPMLDSLHGTDMHREVPAFTASIDAAMTLAGDDLSLWHILTDALKRCARVPGRDLATEQQDEAAFRRRLPAFVAAAALKARFQDKSGD